MVTALPDYPVYLVDDDEAVRTALQLLLKTADIEAHTYSDPRDFPGLVHTLPPGCIVLDIRSPRYRLYTRSKQTEKRALLGEHEARISHSSRVNLLGELSSGIAHELIQPLTAILKLIYPTAGTISSLRLQMVDKSSTLIGSF